MTIQLAGNRLSFTCDGTTTVFPVNLQAYLATDFTVILTSPAGLQTTLVMNGTYSLAATGTLQPTYWTMTTTTAYAAGNKLQVFVNPAQVQQTQYVQGQAFPSAAVLANVDRLTQMVQRLQDQISRTPLAPDGDVAPAMGLPTAALRASTNLGFDANGNAAINLQLLSGTLSTATLTPFITTSLLTAPLNLQQTAAEIAAGVVPINYAIPSHLGTGEVYPYRYGAKFDGVTPDTVAINNALLVATQAKAMVVLPGATAMVGNLICGTNSATGASSYPAGIRGQGPQTVLKAIAGTTGTLLQARGMGNLPAGAVFRDFMVDCNLTCSVGIDTSWPATLGTSNYNTYENIIVQGYNVASTGCNGWLAINDNQSQWKDIVCRQSGPNPDYYALSGMRIEGSGGSFVLNNVSCSSDFLSVTCQSCIITGGYSFGVRFNESQSGVNYISFPGGTQIYANPSRPISAHFYDANPASHYATCIDATGLYLLAASGTAQTVTFDCGLGGKSIFNGCAFIFGTSTGNWNLYSTAYVGAINKTFVEFNGCTMAAVINNPPSTTISVFKESTNASAVLSDYPARVVYRNTYAFPSGLTSATWTNIVPASAMTESGAIYTVTAFVIASGADNLAATAQVAAVSRTAATGPTTAINSSSTANINNNLTNTITFRYSATVGGYAGVDIQMNIALANGSAIYVNVLRIANPYVTY